MDKSKMIKTGIKVGALVLAGVATMLNDKLSKTEMEETIAKKVAEKLAESNQEA